MSLIARQPHQTLPNGTSTNKITRTFLRVFPTSSPLLRLLLLSFNLTLTHSLTHTHTHAHTHTLISISINTYANRRETRRRRPPSYRVLLHNDNVNKREYVVQVLLRVVEGYTVEDALNVMQEAHFNGLALVTECAQDEAENICEGMRNSGLISTIEPAGPGGC